MDSRPTHSRPAWLDTAVFYEIYPQSFADANGDGIGDWITFRTLDAMRFG